MKLHCSDRSHRLFHRVREDASSLRHNLQGLVASTVYNDVPENARTILQHGRRRLDRTAALANEQLQQLGANVRTHKTSVLAGATLLTALGFVLWWYHSNSQNAKKQIVDSPENVDEFDQLEELNEL